MRSNEDWKKLKGAPGRELATNLYYNMDATRLYIVEHEQDLGLVTDSEL